MTKEVFQSIERKLQQVPRWALRSALAALSGVSILAGASPAMADACSPNPSGAIQSLRNEVNRVAPNLLGDTTDCEHADPLNPNFVVEHFNNGEAFWNSQTGRTTAVTLNPFETFVFNGVGVNPGVEAGNTSGDTLSSINPQPAPIVVPGQVVGTVPISGFPGVTQTNNQNTNVNVSISR